MATLEQRVSLIEGVLPHLATKEDMVGEFAKVRVEVAQVRTEIACSESRMVRWMAAWTIGGMIGITGLVITVIEFLG